MPSERIVAALLDILARPDERYRLLGEPTPETGAVLRNAGQGLRSAVMVAAGEQAEVLVCLNRALEPGLVDVLGDLSRFERVLFVEESLRPGDRLRHRESRSTLVRLLSENGFRITRTVPGGRTLPITEELPAAATDSDEPTGWLLAAERDDLRIRSYRQGDEDGVLDLFERCFHHRRSREHWRWKYVDNPWGSCRISLAFDDAGELIAHYGAYPTVLLRQRGDGAERIVCHQVGDTMTALAHRSTGRGKTSLLARTARHFYATFCDGQVAYNYGFNTGNIQRFSCLFLGALQVAPVDHRVLEATHFTPRRAASRWLRRYRVRRVGRPAAEFDDLFERCLPSYRYLVERRSPYLQWRYLERPDCDYAFYRVDRGRRLVGWAVFHDSGHDLLWGDALFDPHHAAAAGDVIAAALHDHADAKRIVGWFSRRPVWWHQILERLGFVGRREPNDLGMVVVPFLEPEPVAALRRDLYLMMGDGDLF